jgi:hypothetical protein
LLSLGQHRAASHPGFSSFSTTTLRGLIRLDDAASEMDYAAALIETWLRGGLEIGGRRQRVQPGDIAVL